MRTGSQGGGRRVVQLLAGSLAAAALAALSPGRAAPAPLQVGYAEADITPPLGGSMPGYFRDRRATGVLDPLHARVLYLRQGGESAALVACDLIGMGAPIVERIRAAAAARERRVRMPEQVWVHCSHTHTGGMLPRGFTSDAEEIYPGLYEGEVDPAWVESLVRKVGTAVVEAAAGARAETAVTLHEGREDTVARYRRFFMKDGTLRTNPGRNNPDVVRPAGEIDPRVTVLRFSDRRVLTVIYGLHPDCVGGTRYSADYPYHLVEGLRESQGPEWRVIFLNAACGNINHIDVRNAAQRSGPNESRRIGRTLAAAAAAALREGRPVPAAPLEVSSTRVASRLRRPRAEEAAEAEERLRTGRDPFAFNGLFAPAARVLFRTKDREHPAEIAALRLGDFGLATMPGEIFVELAAEVEAASPFRPTRTLGLTNGAMGYIPTREGYRQGGYEASYRSARYEPENGHRWAAVAIKLLRKSAGNSDN